MKERLLAMVLPASAVAVISGIGAAGVKLGFISPPLWELLWPWLVALALLALSLGLLYLRAFRWVWPPAVGFVVQAICSILLFPVFGWFETGWDFMQWTLGAIGITALVVIIVWVVSTVRTRQLEQDILKGDPGAAGEDQQKLEELRRNMKETLELLRRAGAGRNAIYELPWFLFTGCSQVGKTVAIRNSGLGLPVRRDRVKGVGGTHTCDYFFTNEAIFLDTPGSWAEKGVDERSQKYWTGQLNLLRKARGRRPLDGLVVVVPADHLLLESEDELREQAANIREVVDLIHRELRFRFPVYILVSKCDLVEGFVDFFRGLPAQRRNEILGWSNPDPGQEGDPGRLVARGFRRVHRRLEAYRLEMLARVAKVTRARRLFFFPAEFERLGGPLGAFIGELFRDDPYNQPPVFRGFYFTSGTQGEGSPMAQVMNDLARRLGVRARLPQEEGEEEAKRSYFLLDVFRTLVVGDEGLVSRTAVHWWRRRRDTAVFAFLPAGLVWLFLLFSLLSFALNGRMYRRVEREVPETVTALEKLETDGRPLGHRIGETLPLTEALRDGHRKLVGGFAPQRSFGMRWPGRLPDELLRVFRNRFESGAFVPTLRAAQEFIADPRYSCTDSVEVLYGVVWLRRKSSGSQWDNELRGLERVWELSGQAGSEAREMLDRQFAYLRRASGANDQFLTEGFSLATVARAIQDKCGARGAGSSLEVYRQFQEECSAVPSGNAIRTCYQDLQRALRFKEEDFGRLKKHIKGLQKYLADLSGSEPGVNDALEAVNRLHVDAADGGGCLKDFESTLLPKIRDFAEQGSLIEDCRRTWEARRSRGEVGVLLRKQKQGLQGKADVIRAAMQSFNDNCSKSAFADAFSLNDSVLLDVMDAYRRTSCLNEPETSTASIGPPPKIRVTSPGRNGLRGTLADDRTVISASSEASRSKEESRARATATQLGWFAPPDLPSSAYTVSNWESRKARYEQELADYVKDLPPAEAADARARIQKEVELYSRGYAQAWKNYLASLTLKPRTGTVSSWLIGLAETSEYASLLQSVDRALPADERSAVPEFAAMSREMSSLGGLRGFIGSKLGQYQSMLRRVGEALKRCDESAAFWQTFKTQVRASQADNVLVSARNWVEMEAGPGLANGRLKDLLLKPLSEAEADVFAGDRLERQWADLLKLDEMIASKFPFSGDPESEIVKKKDLASLLGGESGAVPAFRTSSDGGGLSPAARAWIQGASVLSRMFFEEGTDSLRRIPLTVSVQPPAFEPAELSERYRLEEVRVDFGEGNELRWNYQEPEDRSKRLDVVLFGDDASAESMLLIKVAEAKAAMSPSKWFGSEFKPPVTKSIKAEGAWAPIRLLVMKSQEGGGVADSKRLQLSYAFEVDYKRNKPGRLVVHLQAAGDDLPSLLRLMKQGREQPPSEGLE